MRSKPVVGAKILVGRRSGDVVRARDLAGVSNMMFWRNSVTGALEARPRTGTWGGLNDALHTN